MYDIDQLRQEEFPLSQHLIYFNHASVSPLPQRSRARMEWALEQFNQHPMRFFQEHGKPNGEVLQQLAAKLLNAAAPDEIVPVTTTSLALNMIAQAVNWQPGDNLLFCEGEFPSNAYPWQLRAEAGVEIRQVPAVDGGLTLAALRPLVDEKTRLITVSAIQFFSGQRADLAEIGRFCYEHNILFIVDAIQAIGHIPIDVEACHIDVLASGGQKSLLGPPGQGLMYVRASVAEQMTPRIVGSGGTQDFLHWLSYDLTPLPAAQRFGIGTPNIFGMFAVTESLGLLLELGLANIDRHTCHLADVAIDILAKQGYGVVTPADAHGPIVTFDPRLDEAKCDELVVALDAKGIAVVKHLDAAGKAYIRLSFHAYNTVAEVERFGAILAEIN